MTHDYKRHGTTTLFAALNVLDGTVIGRCMQRHRHQEFIRFLNAIEAAVPAGKIVHVILDNYAAHKQPKVLAWLARHPRFVFHLYGAISVKRWVALFISFFDRTTTISSSRPGKASPLARSGVGCSSVEEQRLFLPRNAAGHPASRCLLQVVISKDVDTEGSPPASAIGRARVLVFGGSWDPNHDAIMRIEGRAPGRRFHSSRRCKAHVEGRVTAASDRRRSPAVFPRRAPMAVFPVSFSRSRA
jgi:hypothetical protein